MSGITGAILYRFNPFYCFKFIIVKTMVQIDILINKKDLFNIIS